MPSNDSPQATIAGSPALPPQLRYRAAPELVRLHEQWQAALRESVSKLQSSGHVRAPEAILNTVMPLFQIVDGLFVMLQADLSQYTELAMSLSAGADDSGQIIAGLLPDDAETLSDLLESVAEKIDGVQKELGSAKKNAGQVSALGDALDMLAEVQQAVLDAALDEDMVPDEDETLNEEASAPNTPAPLPDGYDDASPLAIEG